MRTLILLLILCSTSALADYAVIVHPDNQAQLAVTDIRRIYLIKIKQFPDGSIIQPIDRPGGTDIRSRFVREVIGVNENQLRGYWARLLFTGKGLLPRTLTSDKEVVEAVANNPDTIGFISSDQITDSVRVLLRF